jgi:hypothetical protein
MLVRPMTGSPEAAQLSVAGVWDAADLGIPDPVADLLEHKPDVCPWS